MNLYTAGARCAYGYVHLATYRAFEEEPASGLRIGSHSKLGE